jgi:uncharacterized protein with GYD domain
MPAYVTLINWTDQGVKTAKDTVDRFEGARDQMQELGVTFTNIWWTVGLYDIVAVLEAPDEETATAGLLAVAAGGNIRTTTMHAFTPDEMRSIIERIA